MPRVFISYSSDSDAHKERVKNFADFLVDNGIDIEFDQYTPSPQYGWPEYMVDSIEKSDFVLCVCTKEYKLRFENKAPIGKGKGAKFEGKIIADIVYEQEYNSKFLPIIFDKTDSINIPRVIHPDTYYCVDSQQGMLALYARLTNQPLVNKPKLGKIVSLDIFRNESQKTAMPENSDARKQQYSKSEIRSLLKEELAHLRGRETLFSSEIVIRDLFDNKYYIQPKTKIKGKKVLTQSIIDNELNRKEKVRLAILGDSGAGKSLFIIKNFICIINKYIRGKSQKIPLLINGRDLKNDDSFLQYISSSNHSGKEFLKNIPLDKFEIFIDGLDEIKSFSNSFFDGEIFRNCHMFACKDKFYNDYCDKNKACSKGINIEPWEAIDAQKIARKNFDYHKFNIEDQNYILTYISSNKKIYSSPLICSLFLYSLENESQLERINWAEYNELKNDKTIEIYIINKAIEKYCKRVANQNYKNFYLVGQRAAWLTFLGKRYESLESVIEDIFQDKSIICNKEQIQKFLLSEFEFNFYNKLVFKRHEKIREFLSAKYLIHCIKNKNYDESFFLCLKPYTMNWFVSDLIRINDFSEDACDFYINIYNALFEKFIKSIRKEMNDREILEKNPKVALAFNQILFDLACTNKTKALTFLVNQLNVKHLPKTALIAIYDGLIQYGKKEDNIKYEEIFYTHLRRDSNFEATHRATDLIYYKCCSFETLEFIKGDSNTYSWGNWLDAVKRHFKDKDVNHYYLRRIELFQLMKYVENDTKMNGEKRNDYQILLQNAKIFLEEIKNEITLSPSDSFGEDVRIQYLETLTFIESKS